MHAMLFQRKTKSLVLVTCILLQGAVAISQVKIGSKEYASRAEIMYAEIWKSYRQHQHQLFLENFPAEGNDSLTYLQGSAVKSKEVSFLWPMSGLFTATNVLLANKNLHAKYLPFLDSLSNAYEMYRDTVRKPAGYQAYPVKFEKSDRYYDDNGLVGIDYAEAYLNTKDRRYLEKSKEVFRFIISGWDSTLGGGVTWLEGHRDQKPACSNGMATLTALKLYESTRDTYYLNWGKKFYHWMHDHLRDSMGVYWNDIKPNKTINYTQWTYNSGSMLEASVLLYRFTNEKWYLSEAKQIARATFETFTKQNRQPVLSFHIDVPWFVTVLFRGYESLYRIDHNPKYLLPIINSLNYAWNNAKDQYGFITRSWTDDEKDMRKPKWLLDQACIAELYGRISALDIK
jgi:uncharacterized protein YyaL (SSP411 family)